MKFIIATRQSTMEIRNDKIAMLNKNGRVVYGNRQDGRKRDKKWQKQKDPKTRSTDLKIKPVAHT